jgi:hypothetical protein
MPSGKGTYGTKKGRPPKRKPKWLKRNQDYTQTLTQERKKV